MSCEWLRSRPMHRLLVVSAMAAMLSLAACGDGPTTVVERTITETAPSNASPPTAPPPALEPSGILDYDGVGAVKQGMTTAAVRERFGEPDQVNRGPGCELNPDAGPETIWSWDLPEGEITLTFDRRTDELQSYTTTSPAFRTVDAIQIGDTFTSLKASAGGALKPLDLGAPSTRDAGWWYLERTPRSHLTFEITGGKVNRILGGYTPACE